MDNDHKPMNRLLSIDGGGIRGFLSIEILKRIEKELAARYREQMPVEEFRLCHYFNFIGGTSVGAILAAMLSLGWRMKDVEHEFREVAKSIFKKSKLIERVQWSYTDKELAQYMQKHFCRIKGGPCLLGDDELKSLLMVVCYNASSGSPWLVTNNPEARYSDVSRPDCNLKYPLWKVVRASTAAPMFFPPEPIITSFKDEIANVGEFLDGGITALNNPAFQMYLKATLPQYRMKMDQGVDKMALVSVGTGNSDINFPRGGVSELHAIEFAKLAVESLFDASVVFQDILCRERGDYRNHPPEVIDRELGDLKGTGEGAFSYHRFNPHLTRFVSLDSVDEIGHLKKTAAEYCDQADWSTLPGGALWPCDGRKRVLRGGQVEILKNYRRGEKEGSREYLEPVILEPIADPVPFKQPQNWRMIGSIAICVFWVVLFLFIWKQYGLNLERVSDFVSGKKSIAWKETMGKGLSLLLCFSFFGMATAFVTRIRNQSRSFRALWTAAALSLGGLSGWFALNLFKLPETPDLGGVLAIMAFIFALGSIIASSFLVRWRRWLGGVPLLLTGLLFGFACSFFIALGFPQFTAIALFMFALSVAGVHLMWFGRADLRYLHLRNLKRIGRST